MSSVQTYDNGRLREQWTNATQPGDPTPAGYSAWDAQGIVTTQRALTTPESSQLAAQDAGAAIAANQSTVQQQAQAALVNNRTYLAVGSPNNAQVVAQMRALTQQVQGLIRLALQQFDGTN